MARDKNAEERIESIAYAYGAKHSGDLASDIYNEEVAPVACILEKLVVALMKPENEQEIERLTEEGRKAVLHVRGLQNFRLWADEDQKAEPIKDN